MSIFSCSCHRIVFTTLPACLSFPFCFLITSPGQTLIEPRPTGSLVLPAYKRGPICIASGTNLPQCYNRTYLTLHLLLPFLIANGLTLQQSAANLALELLVLPTTSLTKAPFAPPQSYMTHCQSCPLPATFARLLYCPSKFPRSFHDACMDN